MLSIAKKISQKESVEIANEAYIKLYDKQNLNDAYIYTTLKNIFIDWKKENKFVNLNFDVKEVEEEEKKDYDFKLTTFQKLLIQSLYGINGTNYKGTNLKTISKETGISYSTLCKEMTKIKEKLKDLETL